VYFFTTQFSLQVSYFLSELRIFHATKMNDKKLLNHIILLDECVASLGWSQRGGGGGVWIPLKE